MRLGYQCDGIANHQYLSAGVGWYTEGSGVDFAYRHELGGHQPRGMTVVALHLHEASRQLPTPQVPMLFPVHARRQ